MTEHNDFPKDEFDREEFEKKAADIGHQVDDFARSVADEARDFGDTVAEETRAATQAVAGKAREVGETLEEKFRAIDKMTPKELGDAAVKFATDTAYAAAGFANLVAEKAREFTEKQRVTFADTGEHPEGADRTRELLDQVTAQVNRFVEEIGHTYKELSDRGREAVARMQAQAQARAEAPRGDDAPGPFDIVDDADAVEHTGDIPVETVEPVEEHRPEHGFTKDWGQDNR